MVQDRYQLSAATIQGGSKSFRLASLVLNRQMREGAYLLYRWCRHCDDVIDNGPGGPSALGLLQDLKLETERALQGVAYAEDSPFSGLWELHKNYGIPTQHFFELLEGFSMDVAHFRPETTDDLMKYCYHVAGVVGLMMAPILGVQRRSALHSADQLGRAMQLTNIARDVREDFLQGRLYLPQSWLDEAQITSLSELSAATKEKLFPLVLKLLERADQLYVEGRKGLKALPFRAAWSISIASFLYQGIGWKIRRQGVSSLDHRTVLGPMEKFLMVLRGSAYFMRMKLAGLLFIKGEEGINSL